METGKRRRRPRRRSLSAPDERAPRLPASSGPLSIALVPLALTATALVAYQPAWHGDLLWDDAAHMARADLRSPEGLWRIWFDLTATQQYYPLTHSAFWVMARLWGASTLGYHLVNILLHALSATLVVVILRRLAVPGAALAGLIFALHPVHVESVAWIAELKNTLSGVLYLTALLAWLHFDRHRRAMWYVAASLTFVLALLAKTVTATLPGALLVVLWFARGRLRWRHDVLPVLPLAAVGLVAGLLTAWVERTLIGAAGAEFQLSFVERVLLAGRAAWFYLGKIVWPIDLVFVYPRWSIDAAVWWQYLFPAAWAAVLVGLWRLRTWSRAPLAAALFFLGTLFPALGFFNVYPFRFSYVADHFQYLASLGPIAVVAAGLTLLVARVRPALPAIALAVIVGLPLGVLTWREAHQYADAETLYRTTIARNPAAWLAHVNLGEIKVNGSSADVDEAIVHLERALALNPDIAEAHNNLGLAWQRRDRFEEAVRAHREAIRLIPGMAEAHYNLGNALGRLGRFDEAIAAYEDSLRIDPVQPRVLNNLANVLVRAGRFDEAISTLQRAVAADGASATIRQSLGDAFLRAGRDGEAIAAYEAALDLDPGLAGARNNLALALRREGRMDEALAHAEEAARLEPDSALAHRNLGSLLAAMGRGAEAVAPYRRALALASGAARADLHNELGTVLASFGRLPEAIGEFEAALALRPDLAAARANLERARAARR